MFESTSFWRKSPSRHSVWYSEQPVFLHCSTEFRWHSLSIGFHLLCGSFSRHYNVSVWAVFRATPWLIPNVKTSLFSSFSICWCWCHTSVRSVSGLSGTLLLLWEEVAGFCHAIPTAGLARYNFRLLRSFYLPCQLRCRLSRSTGWQWCEPDKWKGLYTSSQTYHFVIKEVPAFLGSGVYFRIGIHVSVCRSPINTGRKLHRRMWKYLTHPMLSDPSVFFPLEER